MDGDGVGAGHRPAILDAETRLLNAATTGVGPAVDERLASRVAAATTSAQDLAQVAI